MAGKQINVPVVIFSSLLLFLLAISVVSSSISADHNHPLEYETLVPTLLPTTELDTLSWDTQFESEPQYSRSLSLKLHHVDNLIMSSHHQGGKITSESLFDTRLQRDALRTKLILAAITKSAANRQFSSPVISGLEWGSGEYFTRIGVGTPAKYFYMTMDTGSDIIWLQCLPCKKCYEQVDALFNPRKSSSFRGGVPCKSKICDNNGTTSGHCLHNLKRCPYNVSYGDGSFSSGQVVTETLTFGRTTKVPNVIIGCGHDNEGLFVAAAGMLGLARDKQLSFLGQAGNKFGSKFSYCLANRWGWPSSNKSKSSSSYLIFGDSTACGKAVYTPLVKNPILDVLNMFYYVGLEGISVGGSRVQGINASTFDFDLKTGDGGVIVDSGTVVTRLTNHIYSALRDAFRKGTKHLKRASKYSILDTCYYLSGMSEVKVPTVELHFHGGANMSLPASNYMIAVDDNGTHCFAFAGTADSDHRLSIIGNIQQQGFGMVFDVANNRLGFAPNAC